MASEKVVVDLVQEYGPDLPFPSPEQTGWTSVVPFTEHLEQRNDAPQGFSTRIPKEVGRALEKWAGSTLYVRKPPSQETELSEPILFAQYLTQQKILKSLERRPNPTDIPQLIKFSAFTQEIGNDPTDGHAHSAFAHGFSLSPVRSLWKALGELAERYSQTRYRRNEFLVTSFAKLGPKRALAPQRLTAFSEKERQPRSDRQISDHSVLAWARAKHMVTGKTILVPAQLFYYNYHFLPEEPILRQPISTGSAGAFSLHQALYGGLCEAIERDAFMIAYMNRLPLPRVDLGSIRQPEIRELVEAFTRYHLRLEVVDMTTDIRVPSMLAIIIDEASDRGPAVCIGAKTDTDVLWAVRGAIEEAWHALTSGRRNSEHHRELIFRKWEYKQVVRPDDRMWFWGRPEMRKHIQFFLHGPLTRHRGPQDFGPRDPKAQFEQVLSALHKAELYDIFFRDLTVPALVHAGFHVVFTTVPELTPLFIDETARATGSRRLQTVPIKMGYTVAARLNPVPHPFG